MKKLMYRALSILAVGVLTAGSLIAQERSWHFRAGLGMGISQFSDYITGDPHFGMRFSGHVLKTFGNHWGVLSGLEYSNKGENHKTSGAISLQTLMIPVYGSYHFDLNPDNRVYVEAGPYYSYVLAGKDQGVDVFANSNKFYERSGFGVGINLGYNYRHLLFRLGYEQGLSKVVNNGLSSRSSEIFIGASWQF